MMVRKFTVLVFFSMFATVGYGQDIPLYIKGNVMDAETGRPLPLVHLVLQKNTDYAITSPEGQYSLFILEPPDTLFISCIGYETKKIFLDSSVPKVFNIRLHQQIIQLPELIVESEKIQAVFRDEVYSVLDYELYGGNIYLLLFRNRLKRSELLLITPSGDTLCQRTDLPGKAQLLFKDCLDNIHLINNDFAYSVKREGDKLLIKDPMQIDTFNITFGDCITRLSKHVYYHRHSRDGMILYFFGIDQSDGSRKDIITVRDEFLISLIYRNPQDRAALDPREKPGRVDDFSGSLEFHSQNLENYRNAYIDKIFKKKFIYTAVKAPSCRVMDYLVIFDFPGSKIHFFDGNNNLVYETDISFHHKINEYKLFPNLFREKTWTDHDVLVDEKLNRAYILEKNSALYKLKEVNLLTGELKGSYTLSYPFPQKICIYNGYAYFLYTGTREYEERKLFRQALY